MSTRGSSTAVLAAFLLSLPATALAQGTVPRAEPTARPTSVSRPPSAPPAPPASERVAQRGAGPSVGIVVDLSVEMGGDRVAETLFEDGGSQTMRAGQGGTGAVGLELRPSDGSPLAVRGTVGYKFVTTAADNANIRLTRIPIELVGTYTFPNEVFVGAGVVRHSNIRFNGDGFGPDVDFEDANGATVEAGWRWVALTYTMITYTDEFGDEYDASSPGVSIRGTFRL